MVDTIDRRGAAWLRVDLVDTRQSTVQRVRIWAEGHMLQIAGHKLLRQVPLAAVDWGSTMGPASQRMARLPDGSALCAIQTQAWDDWCDRTVRSPQPPAPPLPWPRLWPLGTVALALLALGVFLGR
jgi:hypothetical protein